MALYRKYRPATFAEVVGQEHVTTPLSAALDSRGPDGEPNRINHAYLFSGPRGCGKTSSARILARSLNCVEGPTSTPCGVCESCVALAPGGPGSLDVMELDAASHSGVDDMREIREQATFNPANAKYRIFIIDEAHMITTQGFNALLKIVEEPPEHVIFIFATTDPEKMLTTIKSRTHNYPFRLLTPPAMKGLLKGIVEDEHVEVSDAVYPLVIRTGGGSPRDSLSVLDQLIAGSGPEGVTYESASRLLGVTEVTLIDDAVTAIAGGDRAQLFECVDRMIQTGHDPRAFATDLLDRMRDLIMLQAVPDAIERGLVDVADENRTEIFRQEALAMPPAALTRYAEVLHEGLKSMAGATSPRLLLEVLCARLLLPGAENGVEALAQRLEALERGMPAVSSQQAAAGSAPDPAAAQADPTQASPSFAPAAGAAGGSGSGAERALAALQAMRGGSKKDEQEQKPAAEEAPKPETEAPAEPEAAPQDPQAEQPEQAPEPDPTPEPVSESTPEPTPAPAPEPEAAAAAAAEPAAVPEPESETEEQRMARKAREAREASQRMQEYARQQERLEREREAMEKEAATRRAEGLPEDPTHDEPAEESAYEAPVEETAPQPEEPTRSEPTPDPVPEPEPAPDPAPVVEEEVSGQVDVGKLGDTWNDIMDALPESALPVRVLAGAAVPLELDGDQLTIGHHTGALANRLNTPDYAEALGAAIEQVHGISVSVRCVVGSQQSSGARRRQSNAPAGTPETGGSEPQEGARPQSDGTPASVAPQPETPQTQALQPAAPEAPRENVPEYKRVLEQRERAKAARQAQENPASNAASAAPATPAARPAQTAQPPQQPAASTGKSTIDELKKKFQPAPGHNRRRDDDIPPPPEPYDDPFADGPPPPPPEPFDDSSVPPEPSSPPQPSGRPAPGAAPGTGRQQEPAGPPSTSPAPTEAQATPAASASAAPVAPAAAPSSPAASEPTPGDNGISAEEKEYLDAMNSPGQRDTRELKEVVMELLEKELGAKPL